MTQQTAQQRTVVTNDHQADSEFLKLHTLEIKRKLHDLGADEYDMLLPETHVLSLFIQPDEKIIGIVYGKYRQNNGQQVGRGVLVATNQRLLLIDKKPLFVRCDEIAYAVISAISYTKAGIAGTVTLHTRMGDISCRTFNKRCAQSFVRAIEMTIFKVRATDEHN